MTLQEQLRLCIGRDRLDDDDQVALVPRWTVKASADELDRLQAAMASAQACCDAYAEENQRFSDECVRLQAENETLREQLESAQEMNRMLAPRALLPKTKDALRAERDALRAEQSKFLMQTETALGIAEKAKAENEALRKENEALRADAARYRWLREQHEGREELAFDAEGLPMPLEPTALAFTVFYPKDGGLEPVGCIPGELDAAIDAAMKEQKP